MKDQLELNRDFPLPFREVKVQQACRIQTIERGLRDFKDQRRLHEFREEQITPIIILDIFNLS